MKEKILIVEDQFVEADYLRLMLTQAGYIITGIARSVSQAEQLIKSEKPDFVLVDIFLKGRQTGLIWLNSCLLIIFRLFICRPIQMRRY